MNIKTERDCETCGEPFRMRKSTDKWCGYSCVPKEKKNPLQRNSTKIIKRSPIRKVSKKQAALDRKYYHIRKAFLLMPENKFCKKYPERRATTVHHKMGRVGYADQWARDHNVPLIIDTRYMVGLSMEGHEWVERNPDQAKELGLSVSRLKKK